MAFLRDPTRSWWLTTVYGPVVDVDRVQFLDELRAARSGMRGPWLLCGDFNMILNAADKNNPRLNRRMMAKFRRCIDDLELSELFLNGRLYTWSNERGHPTLERIDRAFASVEWLDIFPDHWLRGLSSDASDHAPLYLQFCCVGWSERRFRFESIWTKFPGFLDVVAEAWSFNMVNVDHCRLLDAKLRRTATALKSWSSRFVGSVRLQLAMAREIILWFDVAMESRELSMDELSLRRQLKFKCLGLASLARSIARQRSRLIALAEGDANTKLFHLQACHRSRQNFIQQICVDGHELVLEEDKAAAFFSYFQDVFGGVFQRTHTLQLPNLGLNSSSVLDGLDHCFSEEEVWSVIRELPNDKAPGPDGFTGLFFKSTWLVIKGDIMSVFNAFWSLDTRSLYLLNDAYLVLLKKKPDAQEIRDYRPISLIHSVSKLLTKVLSVRLAPKLGRIISNNQSAFIKKRCIHDNYLTVQLICKWLHRRKVPSVFLKIDLARAFDSVVWSFLLELLEFFGFSSRWRDWVAALLTSSSTKLLINGRAGRRICHARGLRQGDPLSPMLFVIVMEALNGLISLAHNEGFLSRIWHPAMSRALLYADDLVVFLSPSQNDLELLKNLLQVFAGASGLHTNLAKCSATPISCSVQDVDLIQQSLGCQVVTFPCIYLGIPLHIKRLRRCDEHMIVDKVAARIPKWKGNLLNLAGRSVLVKSTLSAIPVHVAIASGLSRWAIGAIDRLRRSFLWSGAASAVPGRCKVAWSRLCRPMVYGGLGISDLYLMGIALRVRWCWLQRTDSSRTWAGLPCQVERIVMNLFRASSEIIVGNGETVLFWIDNWLDGLPMEFLAPNLFKAVPRRFHSRTLKEGIQNSAWIKDIRGALTEIMVVEYVEVWEKVQQISLEPGRQDFFRWRWEPDGTYSAASAYKACFLGSTRFLGGDFIWRAKVPPKVKFFAWLAAQNRCWTADRRRRHGLQDDDRCALCDQDQENINHLLLQCVFAREVWFRALRVLSWEAVVPSTSALLMEWWSVSRRRVHQDHRPTFDAVVLLVIWSLWKERNARVFDRGRSQPSVLAKIVAEGKFWSLAGFSPFDSLLQARTFVADPLEDEVVFLSQIVDVI
ncbi:hypothetical protein U9M48_030415 [Paspalum notatum var. saurae]|uniref:Reverse transcriptase domain-containing protein n=1 Tax=Paspalum notatum var. saurae TaxID=547442 RepID=A0AAQ3X2K4_PASNO